MSWFSRKEIFILIKVFALEYCFFLYHALASLSQFHYCLSLYYSCLVFIFVLNSFAVTNSLCIARFMQGKARIHAKRNDRIFKFLRLKRELWNVVEICISKIMHLAQCNFAKDLCSCFFIFEFSMQTRIFMQILSSYKLEIFIFWKAVLFTFLHRF